jgi:hypothetical protein
MTRDRVVHFAALASAICLALLISGCAISAVAVRNGLMPSLDWQIEVRPFHFLLIHNGPTVTCQRRLRDNCALRIAQHEFYIHYIAPTGDRQLVQFRTREP